jgi:hypothetical protein
MVTSQALFHRHGVVKNSKIPAQICKARPSYMNVQCCLVHMLLYRSVPRVSVGLFYCLILYEVRGLAKTTRNVVSERMTGQRQAAVRGLTRTTRNVVSAYITLKALPNSRQKQAEARGLAKTTRNVVSTYITLKALPNSRQRHAEVRGLAKTTRNIVLHLLA